MVGRRLLVTGASGAGTTTLGRALASRYAVPHAEVDDYFWLPTSPPYTHKRPVPERLELMRALFVPRDAWVLSGTLRGWGDEVIDEVDGVVFLSLASDTRLERLVDREVVRYGEAIRQGGANETAHQDFLEWARGYDDPAFAGRSRSKDDAWLKTLTCPVLTLDSSAPVPRLVAAVTEWSERELTEGDGPSRTPGP